jgi:hypothetical protein
MGASETSIRGPWEKDMNTQKGKWTMEEMRSIARGRPRETSLASGRRSVGNGFEEENDDDDGDDFE